MFVLKNTLQGKYNKLPLGAILFEIFSVVFAILVALMVDDWKDNKSKQSTANELRKQMSLEMKSNYTKLHAIQKKHTEQLKRKNNLIKQIDTITLSHGDLVIGISFPTLKSTAWNSIILSNSVTVIDVKLIGALSDIYDTQEQYQDYTNHLLKKYGAALALSDNWKYELRQYRNELTTLVQLGKNLEDRYLIFIEKQKSNNG
jgi:cadmium resistance protein CadD (predicted permease)